MKKYCLFMFCTLLTCEAFAETVELSFDDLPKLIAAQNGYVQAEESYVQGAAAQKGHLPRSFLPEVKAEGGYESFKTGSLDTMTQPVAGAQAKINVFRGGRDYLEGKIVKRKHELAQNSLKKTSLENVLRARMLYADVLFYEEQLAYVRSSLSLNQQHHQRVRKQINAGLATETDSLEFAMQANSMQQERLLFEEDHEHAVEELKMLLGLDADAHLQLKPFIFLNSEQGVFAEKPDFSAHPQLAQLKLGSEISRLGQKQAQRWWTPALNAYSSYDLHPFRERERTPLAERKEYVVGVNLSLNLFDGLQSSTKSRALKFQSQGLARAANQQERELEVQFEKLQHELKTRKEMLNLLKQNVDRSQTYLKLSFDEYSRGVKNASQLFSASAQLQGERQKLSQVKRDYMNIVSALLVMAGQ